LHKKKGCYSAVFHAIEGKLWYFNLILRSAINPALRLHNENISVWDLNISLWIIEDAEKEGVANHLFSSKLTVDF
jgi:hypothetical protein